MIFFLARGSIPLAHLRLLRKTEGAVKVRSKLMYHYFHFSQVTKFHFSFTIYYYQYEYKYALKPKRQKKDKRIKE